MAAQSNSADPRSGMAPPMNIIAVATEPQNFLADALHDGMLEVALAELALRQASDAEVKALAEKTLIDRSQANNRLMDLMRARHIPPPGQLPSDHRKMLENLSRLSGPAFDLTYIHHKLMSHELQALRFSEQARSGTNPDIAAFTANTLPILQQHMLAARAINGKLRPAA